MKKTIAWVAAVGVLLVTIFIVPVVIGLDVQRGYPRVIAHLNSTPGVSVKLLRFHRGWFRSQADVEVAFKSHWLVFRKIILHQTIYNGPIMHVRLLDGQTHWIFARAVLSCVNKNKQFPLKMKAEWHFSGFLDSHFKTAVLHSSSPYAKVILKNLQGRVGFSLDTAELSYQAKIQSGSIDDLPTRHPLMTFSNFVINANIRKENALWYGHRNFTMTKAKVFTHKGALSFNHLRAKTQQLLSGNKTDIHVNYQAAVIKGLGLSLAPAQMTLQLLGLDSNQLTHLIKATEVRPVQAADIAQLRGPLLSLIGRGFQLKIPKFKLGLQKGVVLASGSLTVPAQSSTFQDGLLAGVLGNLGVLVTRFKADLQLQMPRAWLAQQLKAYLPPVVSSTSAALPKLHVTRTQRAQQQLRDWLTKGWLTADGDTLKTQLGYAAGRFTANGKTLNF